MSHCPWLLDELSIVDLHNDLLSYLAFDSQRSLFDEAPRCSLPQLKRGGVRGLCLTIFSETKDGSELAYGRQLATYQSIRHQLEAAGIHTFLAIENCAACIGAHEPLEPALKRLSGLSFVYASLTWNFENRFGGGAHSDKGLTGDGRLLIDALASCATAIDLSHTSDRLASDILNYLDQTNNPLRVIASHSNFRAVKDVPRNLPDEIAQEIVARGGVIGLAFIRSFIGNSADCLFHHIEHALAKGWGDALCIGADFFVSALVTESTYQAFVDEHFFPEYGDASRLASFVTDVQKRFGRPIATGIANRNAWNRLLRYCPVAL
jgi:membrane dipeptidase